MQRLALLACMAALFIVFTGCEKSDLNLDQSPQITEEEPTTYNFRHKFTGTEMNEMVAEFTGESADNFTEEEKFKIMADVRFEQLTGRKRAKNDNPNEANYRGVNDWIAYAITKLKATPSTPDSDAIFVDDADVSTTGVQRLTADAGYSEPVPVNYYQLYSFAYVLNDNSIVDFNNQNIFNFTCNGEDFTFAVRSKAVLLSSGGSYTQASYRCQD